MVRSVKRKPLEELYGAKFETTMHQHQQKSLVTTHTLHHGTTKTAMLRTERAGMGGNGGQGGQGTTGGATTERTRHGDATNRTHREYINSNNYLISSNCPITTTNMTSTNVGNSNGTNNVGMEPYVSTTARRKPGTARQNNVYKSNVIRDDTKVLYSGEGLNMANKSIKDGNKPQLTHRGCCHANDTVYMAGDKDMHFGAGGEHHRQRQHTTHQQMHGQQHNQQHNRGQNHQHQQNSHYNKHNNSTEDKDDDPEEFFELIRQTVQSAIGNTVTEYLNRRFLELGSKIERFSTELKQTNEHLNQLQEHITNKVVHYGEENSRHFRYLCMKSEYDKMFYQHHTMLASKPSQPVSTAINSSISNQVPTDHSTKKMSASTATAAAGKTTKMQRQMSEACRSQAKTLSNSESNASNKKLSTTPKCSQNLEQNPSVYQSANVVQTRNAPNSELHRTCSAHSLGDKSSEMGMREVLEHIQRFCSQMQYTDFNPDQQLQQLNIKDTTTTLAADTVTLPMSDAMSSKAVTPVLTTVPPTTAANTSAIQTAATSAVNIFEDADDDYGYQMSSDDMSTPSDDSDDESKFVCGVRNVTARGQPGHVTLSGAGDCQ